jgi:hypothetical protein
MMCLYRHGNGRFTASSPDAEHCAELGLLAAARILRRRHVVLCELLGPPGFIDLGYHA